MNIITWFNDNVEWLFGGVGITVLAGFGKWAWTKFKRGDPQKASQPGVIEYRQSAQRTPTILFVDDKSFPIVSTLQKSGWPNIRRIPDLRNLKGSDVQTADILFIDVQGVGKALNFPDEGLGLALAVKTEYPMKKVVIYSANTHGNMFHPALNQVDATLPKNASTYQFVQLIEQFSRELDLQ